MSELPSITAAHRDGKLSEPVFDSISEKTAVDALPDTGRVSSSESISDGIPIRSANGEISEDKFQLTH